MQAPSWTSCPPCISASLPRPSRPPRAPRTPFWSFSASPPPPRPAWPRATSSRTLCARLSRADLHPPWPSTAAAACLARQSGRSRRLRPSFRRPQGPSLVPPARTSRRPSINRPAFLGSTSTIFGTARSLMSLGLRLQAPATAARPPLRSSSQMTSSLRSSIHLPSWPLIFLDVISVPAAVPPRGTPTSLGLPHLAPSSLPHVQGQPRLPLMPR